MSKERVHLSQSVESCNSIKVGHGLYALAEDGFKARFFVFRRKIKPNLFQSARSLKDQ